MKNINKLSKTFLYISFSTAIIWIGAYICKLLLFYQLFDGPKLPVKPYLLNNKEAAFAALNAILPVITVTLIMFPAFVIFYTLFLVTSRLSLKKNGWLFISSILIYITAPFEIFLYLKDYKIFNFIYYGGETPANIINLIAERVQILSSFPMILLFAYFAVLFLIVFKPLQKEDTVK